MNYGALYRSNCQPLSIFWICIHKLTTEVNYIKCCHHTPRLTGHINQMAIVAYYYPILSKLNLKLTTHSYNYLLFHTIILKPIFITLFYSVVHSSIQSTMYKNIIISINPKCYYYRDHNSKRNYKLNIQ